MIKGHACPLPLDPALVEILETEIRKTGVKVGEACTVNFHDPTYSAETGGYHPVEIRISNRGVIEYVTDFAFVGISPHAELAKEIDFDFRLGLFQHFGREFPIGEGRELFRLWQRNFAAYYRMGVFRVAIETG